MDNHFIYIAVALVILAVVALLVVFINKKGTVQRLSRLATLAFLFIIAGIVFGEDRVIGYSLIGIGVICAAVDIIAKLSEKNTL